MAKANNSSGFLSLFGNIKPYFTLILICGVFLIGYLSLYVGYFMGVVLGLLPLGLVFGLLSLKYPKIAFYVFFGCNYFIMGIGRYMEGTEFPFATVIDVLLVYIGLILLLRHIFLSEKGEISNIRNSYTLLAGLWLLYACFQLFNPMGIVAAWAGSLRGIAFYMFAVALAAPLVLKKIKDLQDLLILWSVLTIIAMAKALIQKFVGFDSAELFWLFVKGGASTHIINYGVRYFSFFTDAANFGAQMAMSMTVFSIYGLYVKSKPLKVWFMLVAILAFYGLLISGTRAAVAIPFVGYAALVVLSKRGALAVLFSIILLAAFSFLKFTYIGEGNSMIRRMRSALNANDPSMQVRYENQAKLKVYMADKPFGAGLGMGGGKSARYAGNAYLSTIPTDSWFVMLWVETGIVGLVLNIGIMLTLMGYGSYLVLFRIRNNLVKGINIALIGGVSGMIVASYANEILGQFPNGIIIYTSIAMVFMSPKFDKELCDAEETERLAANNHEN